MRPIYVFFDEKRRKFSLFYVKICIFGKNVVPLQSRLKKRCISRSRAEVARQAHNLKVGGSIPSSATSMKKNIILVWLTCALSVSAVERVSLNELQSNWSRYTNHTVTLTTPLVVCGSFYDSLVLAPHRLFCPEERAVGLADGDSSSYRQIIEENRAASIVLHCKNRYYDVRTGDILRGLRARVTGERHLLTGQSVRTCHKPQGCLKRAKRDELRIVGTNIENYFADLGGYATQRTTVKQQTLKTRKVAKALRKMHADIFAVCEMQVGAKAPEMLLDALNKHGNKYDYVPMVQTNADQIGGAYIYNKERVRPYARWLSAYADTANHYHSRIVAQGFETTKDGKRFVVSLSHFKSKRAGRGNYDTHLKRMTNADSLLAMLPKAVKQFGDEDVLLLGDYNCYSQEGPVQKVIRAGYRDMLPLGMPEDYSYSFKGEAGYLDRCFASPSMAEQVVRVRPWHVNADWYYQHGAYKLKDKSHHRYADHDPIIVDIKLQ